MRIYWRLTFLGAALILLLGLIVYPSWWFGFLYEGGFADVDYWKDGGFDAIRQTCIAIVALTLLGLFMHFANLYTFQEFRQMIQQVLTSPDTERILGYSLLIVFISISVAVGALAGKFTAAPHLATFSGVVTDPALSPVTYLYIDKAAVEQLSGQYDPELVPESVVAEIKSSSDLKIGASVDDFLKTELGQNVFQRKMTEYKALAKTPERKLRDLLPYLSSHQLMHRFVGTVETPEEVIKIDGAVSELASHGISVDSEHLSQIREKLLAEQMQRLDEELGQLQGLVLVDGQWTVQAQGDKYTFSTPFVSNVSRSPVAEFVVKRSDITDSNRALIDANKGKPIPLRLFGNVLTGTGNASGRVLVNPEALYE